LNFGEGSKSERKKRPKLQKKERLSKETTPVRKKRRGGVSCENQWGRG